MCKTKHSSKDCNRCLLIVSKKTFSDLVGEPASSLIINFEQVIESFVVLIIFFTFFLSMVNCTFYKRTIKSNCILFSCHIRVRSSHQDLFCKKGVLRNSAKFTRKCLCQSHFFKKETLAQVFSCEFCKIFKNFVSYRTPQMAASDVSE